MALSPEERHKINVEWIQKELELSAKNARTTFGESEKAAFLKYWVDWVSSRKL